MDTQEHFDPFAKPVEIDKETASPETNPNLIYANPKKWKVAADILERYTGTAPEAFQKQIILTNFSHYMTRFGVLCDDVSTSEGSAMKAAHSKKMGVSIIDFSIGSPVAALIIEILATADPKAVLFLGIAGAYVDAGQQ